MATVLNYTFNNLSRIGDDNCSISGRDEQNNEIWNIIAQLIILLIGVG